MDSEYLANPLNREKKRYKYFLRKFENLVKRLSIYTIVFPLSLPFLLVNYFSINKFLFKDFFNQNAAVFIVYILKQKKNTVFLISIRDYYKVLSRFGFIFLIKNFSINCNLQKCKTISFINKNNDYYFNTDYFFYFDKKIEERINNFVLPFYLTKNSYLSKRTDTYKEFRNNKKRFKIIFSGTTHEDWYKDLNFINENNLKFLNRKIILDTLKEKFSKRILILDNQDKLNQIDNSDKDILILETNPNLLKRRKSFTKQKHLELISQSNFFLCMPGASMPICYHLIETCLVGTVPILSYNNYLEPKFTDQEALFYFNKEELISVINKALNMEIIDHENMKKEIINYYDKNLSPESIFDKFSKKVHPLEVFTNVDHTSSRIRINRLTQT